MSGGKASGAGDNMSRSKRAEMSWRWERFKGGEGQGGMNYAPSPMMETEQEKGRLAQDKPAGIHVPEERRRLARLGSRRT